MIKNKMCLVNETSLRNDFASLQITYRVHLTHHGFVSLEIKGDMYFYNFGV